MNRCTIFVFHVPTFGPQRLEESFKLEWPYFDFYEMAPGSIPVDADAIKIETPWYGIFYEDEVLEPALVKSLPIFFEHAYDFLVCLKEDNKNKTASKSPRFFRKDVRLSDTGLMPVDFENLNSTVILNGLIKSHD